MKKLFIILSFLIVTLNCFSQNVQSNNSFLFKPTTNPYTQLTINGNLTPTHGFMMPLQAPDWAAPDGSFTWSNHTLYYHDTTWKIFGQGSGGGFPPLAKLYFDQSYFITGINPYDPLGNNLTVTINPDSLATVTYVNNFFADTTYIFPSNAQQRTNTPPASPADSTWWLIAHNPTGIWVGHQDQLAQRIGSGYAYYDEPNSTIVNVINPAQQWQKTGTIWKLKTTFIVNNGNTIRLPTTIGTNDNYSLFLETHDTARIKIDSLGKVFQPQYINLADTIYTITQTINPRTGQWDTIHARNLFAVTPLRLSNDTLYCDGCTGGGGSETWEQTLTNQGSTPFTTDNTVDFGGHNFEWDNINSMFLSNGTSYEANFNINSASLDNYTDTSDAHISSNLSGIISGAHTENIAINSNSGISQKILVTPDSILISGSNTNDVTANNYLRLSITGLDSSNADPNNIAWFDADNILHRGHINASGSSGISKVGSPAYGLTRTNDSTYIVDTTVIASQIRLTNSLATKLNITDTSIINAEIVQLRNGKQNNLTLTTTGTSGASTLVGSTLNIPQYSGGTSPAGNYGNLQLNRNSAFATPASDSLSFNSGVLTNLGSTVVKGTETIITTATGTAGTDSLLVQNNGLVKKISPTYYSTGGSSGWSLTGNSGITPVTNFLGTTDSKSLRFRTNNTERMIIDSLGRVGIGISTPTYKLWIKGGDDDEIFIDNAGSTYTSMYLGNNGNPKGTFYYKNSTSTVGIGGTSAGVSVAFVYGNGTTGLTINGTTGAISIPGTVSTGTITSQGTVIQTSPATTTYSISNTSDEFVYCNSSTGAFTATLPSSAVVGRRFTIKKTDASANAVTVSAGAGTIDGSSTYSLATQYKYVTIVCAGSNLWYIIGNN